MTEIPRSNIPIYESYIEDKPVIAHDITVYTTNADKFQIDEARIYSGDEFISFITEDNVVQIMKDCLQVIDYKLGLGSES